jgi:hypothetical protein
MRSEKKILNHLYKLRNYVLVSRYRDIDVVIKKSKRVNALEKISYTHKLEKIIDKNVVAVIFFKLLHKQNNKNLILNSNNHDLFEISFNIIDSMISYLREIEESD